MDSKLLIDYCAKAGITVKNSPLASVSPEERDRVMDIIRSAGSPSAPASSARVPVAPSREEANEAAALKTRPIRSMTPRTQTPRFEPAGTHEPEPAPEPVETPVAPVTAAAPEPEAPAVPQAPAPAAASLEAPAPADIPTVAPQAPAVEDLPAAGLTPPAVVASAPPAAPAAPAAKPAAPAAPTPPPARPAPISRGDYVAPSGAGRTMRSMPTTMGSRGETRDLTGGANKGKAKAAPIVAAMPAFNRPVAKPKEEEAKAQRPDIKLTPDGVQTPKTRLGEIMVQNQKDKERTGTTAKAGDAGILKPGDKSKRTLEGMGIEAARDARRPGRTAARTRDEEAEARRGGFRRISRQKGRQNTALKTTAEVESPITVRSLSEAIGRPAKSILGMLWQRGNMQTINGIIEDELATELAMELGVDLEVRKPKDIEDVLQEQLDASDEPETLQPRPPIVTILGHVDHGKTTLIDKLRSANVAASEHGGITQHIAAYQVKHNDRVLTFVDTPGHAAFGEMRARGANVTDLIVLVVAANDGVMPQTVECIAHAKAAGVPMVVALNKVDLPDRNEQRVLQELAAQNVLAAEWGGDTEVVRTSGMTGQGLDDLLDTLLLTSELHEFVANPDRAATGACLEAFRDEGRGPLAWLIVQKGTLKVGDVVLCGEAYGRVRALFNERDEEISEALPSMPVKLAGLDIVPSPGDKFVVLDDLDQARELAEARRQQGRASVLASRGGRRTLEDILNAARDGQVQDLGLIVKADTPGSLEALRSEIGKFEHPEVRVKILHEGVGGVNESDVYLASASDAIIVAFHVIPEDRAAQLAQQEGVDVRRYNIIYEVIDEVKQVLEGMLRPEKKEVVTGRAIVLRTFSISRFGTIAGCRVLNGTIERSHRIHLIRDQKVINSYGIASLRREKDDAREVREGMECGIRLEGFNDIKEGDLLEAYKVEEVKRTLASSSAS